MHLKFTLLRFGTSYGEANVDWESESQSNLRISIEWSVFMYVCLQFAYFYFLRYFLTLHMIFVAFPLFMYVDFTNI